MKSTIILLGLSTLLCTVNAFPSDKLAVLKGQVRNAVADVDRVTRKLELQKLDAEDDVYEKAQSIANKEQDSYSEYKTILISGMQKEIRDFESKGKIVGDCYEKALEGIDVSEKLARKAADTCVQNAGKNIRNNLGFIDNLISTGYLLKVDLENIILECHDTDDLRMESCIVSRLGVLTASLRKLESNAISAQITILPIINNLIMQATKCVKDAYELVYTGTTAIKLGIPLCIEEKNTISSSSQTTISTSPAEGYLY